MKMEKHTHMGKGLSIIALPLILIFAFAALSMSALAATESRYPVITAVSPANQEKDIPVYEAMITATFSKDMDGASINSNTFLLRQRTTHLTGEDESRSLPGMVWYDSETRTATLKPYDPIRPNQMYGNVYTATITTDVTDAEGNAMEHEYIWSFTAGLIPYNTGDTTAQENRTAAVIPATTPPVTSPPATSPPATTAPPTTATSPSLWLTPYAIGVYLLILLGLAILAYFLLRTGTAPTRKTVQTGRKSPFGDVHPVGNIEGVGPKYAKQLSKLNITTTKQLWSANAGKVAAALGIGVVTVQHWQQMAELMAVKGIGPQYAELLERSGVRSIEALAASDPDDLLKHVQMKQDSIDMSIQGNTPGEAIVASWIDAANDHQTMVAAKGET